MKAPNKIYVCMEDVLHKVGKGVRIDSGYSSPVNLIDDLIENESREEIEGKEVAVYELVGTCVIVAPKPALGEIEKKKVK